jgi:hypothetical protein
MRILFSIMCCLLLQGCSRGYYHSLVKEKCECRDHFYQLNSKKIKELNLNIDSVLRANNYTHKGEFADCKLLNDSIIVLEFTQRNFKKEKIGSMMIRIDGLKAFYDGQSFIVY